MKTCSITNLPIIERPEWTRIEINKNYIVTFRIIGNKILQTELEGHQNSADIQKLFYYRNQVLQQQFGESYKIIEIMDFGGLRGLANKEIRIQLFEHLQQEEGKTVGVISYNLTSFMVFIASLGVVKFNINMPILFTENYGQAALKALEVLKYKEYEAELLNRHFITRDDWYISAYGGEIEIKIIPENVLYVKYYGFFHEDAVPLVTSLMEKVFETGYFNNKHYYQIADYTQAEGSSWKARWGYIHGLNKIHKKYGAPLMDYVFGTNKILKAAIESVRMVVGFKIYFTMNIDSAFDEIIKNNKKIFETIIKAGGKKESVKRREKIFTKNQIDRFYKKLNSNPLFKKMCDEIIKIMGSQSWEDEKDFKIKYDAVDENHPFKLIYEAFDMLNMDVNVLLKRRKEAEKKLHQAVEIAEDANKAKSKFLANMSHEIRTPMTGIIGATELALMSDLSHEQRDLLNQIKISADALLNLINDILDFSKIEAGKLELVHTEFNIRESVENIIKILGIKSYSKNIELLCHIENDVPHMLIGDSNRIRQILLNLINNAIKFTHEGFIYLHIEMVKQMIDRVKLRISIQDTGIGIAEENKYKIFQEFSQEDTSITRRFGGTGLGLAISSQLIKMMGGKIDFRSEKNSGTTFSILIDFAFPEIPQGVNSLLLGSDEVCKILLVSHNDITRKILKEACLFWHLECNTAVFENEAIALFKEAQSNNNPYTIIIYDREIRNLEYDRFYQEVRNKAHIILLCSPETKGNMKNNDSTISFLHKPLTHNDLKKAILGALNKTSGRAPIIAKKDVKTYSIKNDVTILLADDNMINIKITSGLLQKKALNVITASNGKAAVEKFNQNRIDLVLMDLEMPEMDGYEAMKNIKAVCRQKNIHIPVIAYTAFATKYDRDKVFDAGFDDYLSKPITPHKLYTLLENYISDRVHTLRQPETRSNKLNSSLINFNDLVESLCGNNQLAHDVIKSFIASYRDEMKQLSGYIQNDERDNIRKFAVKMKGQLLNLRVRKIANLFLSMEKNIDTLEKGELETLYKKAIDYIEEVIRYYNNFLAGH